MTLNLIFFTLDFGNLVLKCFSSTFLLHLAVLQSTP